MKELSERQKEVFEFILEYQSKYGFPPSVREIAERFGFKSNRTVQDYLHALEKKGHIRIHSGKKRGIEVVRPSGIPVVGRIGAGSPIFADENIEDMLEIDPSFFTKGPCFAVKVRGDSMTGAGIQDGDYAIIRKQSNAENGEIVAALIDDEVTLKRFYKREGRIELVAENPAYPPIVFEADQPLILGVLAGIIRKY